MGSTTRHKELEEPFTERVARLGRELERAVRSNRPLILLAIYRFDRVRIEAEAALTSRLGELGQKVVEYHVTGPQSSDIPLALSQAMDERTVYFVSGLRFGGDEGLDVYRALNIRREYFIENKLRVIFWLTEDEAQELPYKAPDFWVFRHRCVEFLDSPTPEHYDEALTNYQRAVEPKEAIKLFE